MRSTRPWRLSLIVAFSLLVAQGCGFLAGSSECPETVAEGGGTDGIDLAVPDWLPEGFPLPEEMSLRHLNHRYVGEVDILTGFVPGAAADAVIAEFGRGLGDAGYDIVLAADGFVPIANEAVVAVNDDLGLLVSAGVAYTQAPVRNSEGDCSRLDGLLVQMRIEQVDAGDARARYAGSLLSLGTAHSVIGAHEFVGRGECLVHAGTYAFSSTGGDASVTLHFGVTDAGTVGSASVGNDFDAVFTLDVTPVSGITPRFDATEAGFSGEGAFIDAVGEEGFLPGRIEVTCG